MDQSTPSRRALLAFGAVAAGMAMQPTAQAASSTPLAAPPSTPGDGLAHPIPYTPPLGVGKDRALALCGGGEYLLSWYMGYFTALKQQGVDVGRADIIVGTSAGAIAGAAIAGGQLWRLAAELDVLGDFPKLMTDMAPMLNLSPSQKRAIDLGVTAKDASRATIQTIGRAAMAAHSLPGPKYATSARRLLGEAAWPHPKLHTTATDCYTGERLIVSQGDGILIYDACAASASWPGHAGPTWLKDRYCMDGGVCQTSTHCDVIAGAKRALVISLSDGTAAAAAQGLRLSSMPNTLSQEIKDLQAGGTKTMLVVAGLPRGISTVNLMDPAMIAPALKWGHERGIADAERLRVFWE